MTEQAVSSQQTNPALSIVILTWNSSDYLPICLTELSRSRGVELDVIVVDNASTDGSLDIAAAHSSKPRTIQTGKNLGFAGGNNVGLAEARHPLVVFLNPDCVVHPDTLRRIADRFAQGPDIGVIGGKLYYPNTRIIQHAGGFLHPNAMAEHYGYNEEDIGQCDAERHVEYVTGALFAVRRDEMMALGGFDPEFWPAYYEEADLCARYRRSGKRVLYLPTAVAWHREELSPKQRKPSPGRVRMSYRARMLYVVKNYGMGEFFGKFVPFELRWFCGPFARGFRWAVIRSWMGGAAFAVRCVFRLKRRPSAVKGCVGFDQPTTVHSSRAPGMAPKEP